MQGLGEPQRLGAILRLADDIEIGVGSQQRPEARTDDGVVVSN